MIINYDVKVDLTPEFNGQLSPKFSVSVGDHGARYYAVQVLQNGEPYTIEENCVVSIVGKKPDGHIFAYSCTYSDSYVYFAIEEQMTPVQGVVTCELVIEDELGNRLGSANFLYWVESCPVSDGDASESDLQLFQQAVDAAGDVQRILDAFGGPNVARSTDDMVNTSKVYVYIGDETGYTYGHWYYYDTTTSTWTDGGIYQSDGVNTDTTLTASGVPADAKAAGDAIDSIKDAIDEITQPAPSVNMYDYQTRNISKMFVTSGGNYGDLTDSTSYDVSDYIPVVSGTTYKIGCYVTEGTALRTNAYTCRWIAEYDAEKAIVGTLINGNNMSGGVYTPSSDSIKFVRFQMSKETTTYIPSLNNIFAILSEFPSEYVPHEGGIEVVLPEDYVGLPERVTTLEDAVGIAKKVVYWGDSLTAGNQDGTGVTRATVMQALLGDTWEVKNFGSGGETANTIASRQGGNNLLVTAGQTIPASGSVLLEITDRLGDPVNLRSSVNGSAYVAYESVNPCIIAGVEGVLSVGSSFGSSPYTFTRSAAGDAVSIDRPTAVITNGMKHYKETIAIIEVGQNGGYTDADDLVKQIKEMLNINGSEKYIICGFTTAGHDTENNAMAAEFGRHFLNTLAYATTPIYEGDAVVSCYGLADVGLTATAEDITRIGEGRMPKSLLIETDNIHLNQYGYTMQANLEYKCGVALGYWE